MIVLINISITFALLLPTFAQTKQKPRLVVQTGHTESVNSVAFSPDGKTIASGSSDNTIKLWNAETGQQLNTLKGHTDLVESVAFSPDGENYCFGKF